MKKMTYTTLATLVLSAVILTACGNKAEQAVSTPASSAQVTKQVAKTATSSSAKKLTFSSAKQAVPSQSSQSTAPVASSVAETSEASSASVPETSNSQVSETSLASSAIAQTSSSSSQVVTEVSQVGQEAPATGTQGGFLPEVVVGDWKSALTGQQLFQIEADGRLAGSDYYVGEYIESANGQVTLRVTSQASGGYAVYYYPAGVPIPLRIVTIIDGQSVFQEVADPTDISRDRVYYSNGIWLDVTQEQYDSFLEMVAYR